MKKAGCRAQESCRFLEETLGQRILFEAKDMENLILEITDSVRKFMEEKAFLVRGYGSTFERPVISKQT